MTDNMKNYPRKPFFENNELNLSEIAQNEFILDLVGLASKRDQTAFGELYERYKKSIYYYLFRMTSNKDDAEELMQETFFRAWQALPNLKEKRAFSTWLFRIATNLANSTLRKRKIASFFGFSDFSKNEDDIEDESEDGCLYVLDEIDTKRQAKIVRESLDKLSPMEKTAFVLRILEEKSTEETANIMERSEGTIKSLVFRARKKMTEYLSQKGFDSIY